MNDLIILVTVITILLIVLAVATVFGHVMWLLCAAILRSVFNFPKDTAPPSIAPGWRCVNCNHDVDASAHVCNACGSTKPSGVVVEQLKDLAATERQLERFRRHGKLDDDTFERVSRQIHLERVRLTSREPQPTTPPTTPRAQQPPAVSPTVVVTPPSQPDRRIAEPAPSFSASFNDEDATANPIQTGPPSPPPPRPPRRTFTEMLNSFMEESNIRWGEIVGGLLIIGCSTALVVSLWAQISQIPVLKFLIFTTVTAILFGVGLYTEHRWKLPTTSRAILTIATLLVPLNFLAIAAVSASNTSGLLVIGSELAAPAIFLCLVYFAGRVITPGCGHLLSAGVLGSSIGQLLVRHFASLGAGSALLIFLGAFPVTCYVVSVGLALRLVLSDREIDESETTTVFTMLGTMSFAALLPFGLLLYKSGPLGLTMMYLAPLVTLWGLPMLATGTVLWRRIKNQELVGSRTAGTALGILGAVIVLAGIVLAWPNPASIVPAALLNFAIFTVLAIALELPAAHLLAATCFGLAYLVVFHVTAERIPWENLRVMSLLQVSLSASSGQALAGLFCIFVVVAEWLSRRRWVRESYYYLIAACSIAVISLTLVTSFGLWLANYQRLWIVYGVYALGACVIAWLRNFRAFTWVGSGLLLFSLVDAFGNELLFSFPWQTALLTHAMVCVVAAIVASRYQRGAVLSDALNYSSLMTLILAVVSLFQTNPWQVTSMQAERVFWIAGIMLLSLWFNRERLLFTAFQIATTAGVILSVKAALQQYEWYSYLPHAFLHPTALQIQGTVLIMLGLAWVSLRLVVKQVVSDKTDNWLSAAWRLLDSKYAVDRLIPWLLLGGFLLPVVYGGISGVTQELSAKGSGYLGWDLAGFPHQDALGLGSWIVLGLLTITMLANQRERNRGVYLLGALATVSAAIPLLAGRFESQIATASAWRWLAALFLVSGSVAFWYRSAVARLFDALGWPRPLDTRYLSTWMRHLLVTVTVAPMLLLTFYPALRAIYYLSVQGPVSGLFSFFDDSFNYCLPLVLVALVMVGYAIRERKPQYGLYAGLLFNLTTTLAFLLSVVAVNGLMDRVVLVRLAQVNTITLAAFALPWLSTRHRWQNGLSHTQALLAEQLLTLQVGMALVLNAVLLVPIAIGLIVVPDPAGIGTLAAGSFVGWLAFAVTLLATIWWSKSTQRKLFGSSLALVLLALSCLTAFSLSVNSGWVGLHALALGTTVVAWLLVLSGGLAENNLGWFKFAGNWQQSTRRCAAVIGSIAVALTLRTVADLGANRWLMIAPLLVLTALAATLNWQTLRRRYLYAGGLILNFAVSIWWVHYFDDLLPASSFYQTNMIAACLGGILWLCLELRARCLRGLRGDDDSGTTALSFHNLVAVSMLCVLSLVVYLSFLARDPSMLLETPSLTWVLFTSLMALMTTCLWDSRAKYAVAGLYSLGLVGGAIALYQLQLPATRSAWSATIYLAVYSLIASLLWRSRARLITFAENWGVPPRIDTEVKSLTWLSAATVLSAVAVTALAYWIDLRFISFELRASVALAVAALAVAFGLLAEGPSRVWWQRSGVAILIVGAVLFGWSWLTPGVNATWLNRSVILMVEAFGLTALYGLLLNKTRTWHLDWANAVRTCVPGLLAAGVVALLFCLGTEFFYQISFGTVRIHPVSLVAIGLTLMAAVVSCILFAISPTHDPLGLSERARMTYVYVAEVMLALLFVHIRLTMPWLFTGFIARYWPLAAMVVAYLGVVTSEALRRKKLLVLAQPLERTGVFLPLLPVIGFWLASSQVDYSSLLFVVGGLYGLVSLLRRSFVYGLLAAVAGNAGLWYVLHRTNDYQFLQHPQLWLVPVALSVLLAAYLNEESLTEDQVAGIRYLSLVTIYASSTADIFINGVVNSPWLPLILGAFSLAGVFSGIMFRIRGLLLLGSVFLLLSLITMIWYASVNLGWTWLWYVAGIATGATIIFMFAMFEKKRSEVLRVVEGFREWEP